MVSRNNLVITLRALCCRISTNYTWVIMQKHPVLTGWDKWPFFSAETIKLNCTSRCELFHEDQQDSARLFHLIYWWMSLHRPHTRRLEKRKIREETQTQHARVHRHSSTCCHKLDRSMDPMDRQQQQQHVQLAGLSSASPPENAAAATMQPNGSARLVQMCPSLYRAALRGRTEEVMALLLQQHGASTRTERYQATGNYRRL